MRFNSTRWSLVLRAKSKDPEAAEALNELCRVYWRPLYGYARRRGFSPEDAADLVQEFFAKLLKNEFLDNVDRDRGRFRTFLLTSLSNFISSQRSKAAATKRDPGSPLLSIDALVAERHYAAEPADTRTPEVIFEQQWALALMTRTVEMLREEYAEEDNEVRFTYLKPYISVDDARLSFGEIAGKLNLSEGAVRVALHRLRKRYREGLRERIAETLANPDDAREVDDEIRHFMAIFANPPVPR